MEPSSSGSYYNHVSLISLLDWLSVLSFLSLRGSHAGWVFPTTVDCHVVVLLEHVDCRLSPTANALVALLCSFKGIRCGWLVVFGSGLSCRSIGTTKDFSLVDCRWSPRGVAWELCLVEAPRSLCVFKGSPWWLIVSFAGGIHLVWPTLVFRTLRAAISWRHGMRCNVFVHGSARLVPLFVCPWMCNRRNPQTAYLDMLLLPLCWKCYA